MKLSSFIYFANFGIKTILFKKKEPILGTIIVTDKCNLKCKHCSVNNVTAIIHPYSQIRKEMQQLYDMGIRILFFLRRRNISVERRNPLFAGFSHRSKGNGILDCKRSYKLLSIDGDREHHNAIRGNTYDIIMENIKNATFDNICFYMAINQINKNTVQDVCIAARNTKNVRAVSFNFHTPYPDTKELALSKKEKADCCEVIKKMMKENVPVFNLQSAFPYLINNNFPTPCDQSVVIENGKLSTCGRCSDIPGLCNECGYFFVAEYTLLFKGTPKIIFEMLKTYLKYI